MSAIDIFIAWFSFAAMLWLASVVLPGFEVSDGFRGAASSAVVLSIFSALAGWVLFGVFDIGEFIGDGRGMRTLLHMSVNVGLLFATDKISEPIAIENPGMGALAGVFITVGADIIEPMLYTIIREPF